MATYTSTQAGNWNNTATWGGSGYPSANDDVANVDHEVSYNMGESSVLWGNITVGTAGKLTFPTNASSDIQFSATGVLTVNGELSCGTEESPLGAAYKLRLRWTRGSTQRNVFVTSNGTTSILKLCGSPSAYGSLKYGFLNDNWTTGQTFYVTGDVTASWAAGMILAVHRNAAYSASPANSGGNFTIASVGTYDSANGRTPITISETAPGVTYNAGGEIIALTRNIIFEEIGMDITASVPGTSTWNLTFSCGQNIYLEQQKLSNCLVMGWNRFPYSGHQLHCKDCVFFKTYNVGYSGYGPLFEECDVVNCGYGINGDSVHASGKVMHCVYGVYGPRCYNMGTGTLTVIGCGTGIYASQGKSFTTVKNCGTAVGADYKVRVFGTFSGNTTLCATPSEYPLRPSIVLDNCLVDGTFRPLTIYAAHGTITSLNSSDTGWQTPPSGSSFIFKAVPRTRCSVYDSYNFNFPDPPEAMYHKFDSTGSKTITFKIYPIGWSSSCDQGDIELNAMYAEDSAGTLVIARTGTSTFANDGWRDISVTFNLQNVSLPVAFQFKFKAYQNSCYWLIDPEWSVS